MVYRIGLLVSELHVSHSINSLVDWAESEPDIQIAALIVHPANDDEGSGIGKFLRVAKKQGASVAISRLAFGLLSRVETKLFLRSPAEKARLKKYDIGARVPLHVHTQPLISASGFVYRFSEADIARIRSLELDLLVRCGSGILKGDILRAAKHGVLSMHHADNRVNRGGPPGFWEVFQREPTTGFMVQRLSEELDAGEVLFRGSYPTEPFYLKNRTVLTERSIAHLKQTSRRVLDGSSEVERPTIYDHKLFRTPSLGVTFRYVLKTVGLIARKAARRALGFHWRWGVAYTFGDWRSASLWRGKVIPNPPGHFLADPFAIEHEGRHYAFVEDYRAKSGKAHISVYSIGKQAELLGTAIDEPFHLSFPFLFRFDGQIYMVPESAGGRQIRLYRCEEFPLRWTLVKVLMDDVRAVDSMIFEKDGRWWMLTTINNTEFGRHDSELFVFSADTPLGEWKPHPRNPVIVDAERGRNAGLLRFESEIYRVAQRPSFDHYGKEAAIYRIDCLSETDYGETLYERVTPNFFSGLIGCHHVHHDGQLTVYDFARLERGWLTSPN